MIHVMCGIWGNWLWARNSHSCNCYVNMSSDYLIAKKHILVFHLANSTSLCQCLMFVATLSTRWGNICSTQRISFCKISVYPSCCDTCWQDVLSSSCRCLYYHSDTFTANTLWVHSQPFLKTVCTNSWMQKLWTEIWCRSRNIQCLSSLCAWVLSWLFVG